MQYGVASRAELIKEVKIAIEPLEAILDELKGQEVIFELGEGYLMAGVRFRDWRERMLRSLTDFHGKNHLKPGISKAELKQVLPDDVSMQKLDLFLKKLIGDGEIRFEQYMVALAAFEPKPTVAEENVFAKIRKIFAERGVETPELGELAQELKVAQEKVGLYLEYLTYMKEIILVADGYYLRTQMVTEIHERLVGFLQGKGEITLAEARDLLGSSRKYTLPILEYFDGEGVTKRKDNIRVLA
jgi:selenocysteine-specific elongation factor